MEVNFINVLITVLSLLILAIPGFILRKTNLIGKESDKPLSTIVLYGCQPILMITCFQKTSFDSKILKNMLIVAGLSAFTFLFMMGLMELIYKKDKTNMKNNCLKFASTFANCGYMGLPFIQGLFYGSDALGEALVYGAVVSVVSNIITWSLGIYMISGDKKYISFKKAFLNPTFIGIIIGVLLFFLIKVPLVDLASEGSTLDIAIEKFMQSLNYLADLITPITMTIIGIKIANISFKEIFLDKKAYISSFNKLVLMSLVTIVLSLILPISDLAKYIIFFTLSMPSATNTVMFATSFNGDDKFASIAVLLSTILSIITIPLMYLLFQTIVF